jgi:GntR family transcriptional regulator, rspAB operon transcriptional repressor
MASPSKRLFEIDPSRQAAVQVFEQLRGAIVALQLTPGTAINRAELQSRFGLSSTPIRDALMRLGEEGLVDIFPQSATRVSLIDIAAATQTQFLRRALEFEVVETLCASPDKSVVAILREVIRQQKDAADHTDLAAFEILDLEFHRRMFEAAAVPELYALVRQRSGHIDRIRRLHLPVAGKMQEIMRDHGSIAKAISAGDAATAKFRVRDHLSRSLAFSPALREKYPGYFTN